MTDTAERRSSFEDRFDERVAQAFIDANESLTGLPAILGIEIERFEPGKVFAKLDVEQDLLTPIGNLHGGVIAGLVDHVLGCVAYPLMQPGQWAATTEFKVNYLAPVTSGTLEAESTIVSMSRRTAVVNVRVRNGDQVVALAQGTLMIVDPKPSDPASGRARPEGPKPDTRVPPESGLYGGTSG